MSEKKETAFVIFLNDTPKGIVNGTEEKANEEMEKLRDATRKMSYNHTADEIEFQHVFYYHLHEVPILG